MHQDQPIPQEITAAADKVADYFASHRIPVWQVGRVRSSEFGALESRADYELPDLESDVGEFDDQPLTLAK